MRRPIDCSPEMLNNFGRVVLANGEVPIANLKRGIPRSDMLFYCIKDDQVVGVSAVRYQNRVFHKHLFEKAGVPEMYNPHSLEWCWLSVLPEFQRGGVLRAIHLAREDYMADRPCHGITRADNEKVDDDKKFGFEYIGKPFKAETSDNFIRLGVSNHDPVFDPNKKLRYC